MISNILLNSAIASRWPPTSYDQIDWSNENGKFFPRWRQVLPQEFIMEKVRMHGMWLSENCGSKYVVLETTQGLVFRANRDLKRHAEIVKEFQGEESGYQKCIGGGSVFIRPENKEILLEDFSGDYGEEPDRSQTAAMLKERFPEWTVKFYDRPRKQFASL